MPTVSKYDSKFADVHILDKEPIFLRRHASCPPGTLRQVNPASDPTRLIPASAARSLLITRDDQARASSAITKYSASVSSSINPPDSSWVHVSVTTQVHLELGSKTKDVRIAPETGSFKAVYPPGLGSYSQMYMEQELPLNAWTDPLVYGHYDDGYCYEVGHYHEYSLPIHIHTCLVSSGGHTSSSLTCPACTDLTKEAYNGSAVNNCIFKELTGMTLVRDDVHKEKKRVFQT